MGNGDFIRNSRRTGDSEEWPDGEVQEAAEEDAVVRMGSACQFLQVLTGKANRKDGGKRKTDAGDKESKSGVPGIPSGILP